MKTILKEGEKEIKGSTEKMECTFKQEHRRSVLKSENDTDPISAYKAGMYSIPTVFLLRLRFSVQEEIRYTTPTLRVPSQCPC